MYLDAVGFQYGDKPPEQTYYENVFFILKGLSKNILFVEQQNSPF